jgi:phosphinothricin acetyltransferase
MSATVIRAATTDDAARIAAIYNHYIEHTVVTFEEAPVTVAEMAERIAKVLASHVWLVTERDGEVIAYAYAAHWGARCSYRLSVETSIYVAAEHCGRGHGEPLYAALVDAVRARGFHCAIGGVALPNPASARLHEKLGFEKVAHFGEVGRKFDRWIDVGYWELIL